MSGGGITPSSAGTVAVWELLPRIQTATPPTTAPPTPATIQGFFHNGRASGEIQLSTRSWPCQSIFQGTSRFSGMVTRTKPSSSTWYCLSRCLRRQVSESNLGYCISSRNHGSFALSLDCSTRYRRGLPSELTMRICSVSDKRMVRSSIHRESSRPHAAPTSKLRKEIPARRHTFRHPAAGGTTSPSLVRADDQFEESTELCEQEMASRDLRPQFSHSGITKPKANT